MNQERKQDRKPPIPPGVVLRGIGGVEKLLELEARVGSVHQEVKEFLIGRIRAEIERGVERGLWRSQNAAYEAIGLRQGRGKALMSDSRKDQHSVQFEDLLAAAYQLDIEVPAICPKQHLLRTVVQEMRTQRHRMGEDPSLNALTENDIQRIEKVYPLLLFIDEICSQCPSAWEKWLVQQAGRTKELNTTWIVTPNTPWLVSLGDWLHAYPYLKLFDRELMVRLRRFEAACKRSYDGLGRLMVSITITQGLLHGFRKAGQVAKKKERDPTLADVAFYYPEYLGHGTESIELLLEQVGLRADELWDANAVLGNLLFRSAVVKPLLETLVARSEWVSISLESPLGRRAL